MKKKTAILHATTGHDEATGALSIPVYNASTYRQKDVEVRQAFDYSRSGNPTRQAVESQLAALEGGEGGFAFSSGMAALTAAITAFVKQGDHIVATRDIYGGTHRLLTAYLSRFGVSHTFVDMTDVQNTARAIQPNTRLLLLESPSNPLLRITDLAAHAKLASKHGLVTVIDNTFMTPYLQKPFRFGIDVSVHSATKFLGGHSDLLAGAVMTRTAELAREIRFVQNCCGAVLSPQDSWLLMRGIKTLSARMEVQSLNAEKLAQILEEEPWVTDIYYPGLLTHAGHSILKEQADGFGAVLSFKTDTVERARRIMQKVKYWSVAVSLGGVESILSYPCRMSHAAIPALEREALGVTENLIRLSVGLEDVEDLVSDLVEAAT